METLESLLERLFYNTQLPSGYSSVQNLYSAAKKIDKRITLRFVRDWLAKQDSYTLHKPARKRFRRSKILGDGMLTHVQADLCDMSSLRKYNNNYRYFVTIVCCYSRKIFAVPIKTKHGKEVVAAFKSVFTDLIPYAVITDRGTEFYSRPFQEYCKENQILHYSPNSDVKAALAERANRSLQEKIFRFFSANKSQRWIDVIGDIAASLRASKNRSINMAPNDVKPDTFLHHLGRTKKRLPFSVGDLVRLSRQRKTFEKSYLQSFTSEIFVITDVIDADPPYFRLRDLSGEPILGRVLAEELVKVIKNEEPVYKVEKILRKRRKSGRLEYFVLWDDSTRSWIKATDLVFI